MSNASNTRSRIIACGATICAVALLALSPSIATAQSYCAQLTKTLLDTTDNCVNEPWRDRATAVETFRWKGHDYMILNRGNELGIYQVDDPSNPQHIDTSEFNFDTRGDSDYDLIEFDVCDECRFGVFAHKVQRTVIFDLGTGAAPNFPAFGGYETYEANESVAGGYSFQKGGYQYLIADDLPGSCSYSGLYLVSGLDQLDLLECVTVGGAGVTIKGLHSVTDGSGTLYLYLAERSGPVHVFRADGTGSGLTLAYQTSPAGMVGRRTELSIDTTNKRAASADFSNSQVDIWDVSSPNNPVRRYSIPVQAGTVSLRSPSAGAPSTLFTAIVGWPDSTHTYVVDDFDYALVVDENFWYNDALAHNPDEICVYESGGAVSRDGSVLFLSRYAIHQVFDLSTCLNPVEPTALIEITPQPAYPGDTIEVRDASTGSADRWALWITEGSSPSGPLVAGNSTMSSSNQRTISYGIPIALADGQDYWAHVEVESDDFSPPYDFDSLSRQIDVDRRPAVTISVEPETVVVTDSVSLSAAVNGGSPTSYDWEVRAPGVAVGNGDTYSGQTVSSVSLDVSGLWHFDVVATYQHDDPDGPGAYLATDSYALDVKSVAADFEWSPASPLHNQQITLDGSLSKPSSGLTYEWEVKLGATVVPACQDPTAKLCIIPAETLDPDTTYNVYLTVSNGTESSTKFAVGDDGMYVGNGNVNPTISWSPSSPTIGEDVVFAIDGVPADLDSASWNMGGPGCDGASATSTCNPIWTDCKTKSYSYSTSGTKTVTLEIVVGGNTFTAPSVQVSVQPTGSCSGTPTICTYSLNPTSVEFGSGGGETAVTVNTQSGCSWSASTTTPWLTIVAPTGAYSGTGALRFRVSENTGPYRTGSIIAGGQGLVVNQRAPYVPADFSMTNNRPLIGEVVTFAVDPILEVESWDFGEADCRGNNPQVSCYFLPGSACNTIQWTFPSSGEKTVTMVLTDGRTKTKNPIVRGTGECCLADGRPDADFTSSADEAYTGETISFTDLSAKSLTLSTKALTFSWNPQNPEIGEIVSFMLEGVVGDIEQATWDFGEAGCDGLAAVQNCTPSLWNNCEAQSFTFASSGDKTVTATVTTASGSETVGPRVITVANAGECPGGGGGGPVCTYSVSPTSATYPETGGVGSFDVTTTQDCEWSVISYSSWLHINSGGGSGTGTVEYSVDANPSSSSRSAVIYVEGASHRVTQSGDLGDTAPTEWRWTITRVLNGDGETVDEDYYSSTDQHMKYRFTDPGRYRISLTAINCYGSSTTHRYVEILLAPVANFVVAAAISSAGANGTHWESDFRFFNPCDDTLDVSLVYQPDNQDNSGKQLSSYPFTLGPNETMVFPNAREVVNADDGESINGSILIDSMSESGCKVLAVSRTFNDTPNGTLGLYVPTMPVTSVGVDSLNLTGLISNDEYRSNLRLINHGDAEAWVRITLFSKLGEVLAESKDVLVLSHSTKQINEVAEWAGVNGSLTEFTVLAEVLTDGAIIDGFATVIDDISGDSVTTRSPHQDEPIMWLPGVVFAPGKNDTFWQTDIWLHNPSADDPWLTSEATYVDGANTDLQFVFSDNWPVIESMGVRRRLNIAGEVLAELGVDTTSGYLIFEGTDGDNAPQIAARTFTSDENGGTFGLHLPAYGSDDLLLEGEVGYLVGVSNSADELSGYRTNLGLLATDRTVEVEITFIYPDGTQAPEPWITTVWAGQLKQVNNIFRKFGLGGETVTGTFRVEVVSGDHLIVYTTEIDNMSGDSIFVPAQKMYINPAE
jgi:PKD repeat protein